jgi:hypothetical protein
MKLMHDYFMNMNQFKNFVNQTENIGSHLTLTNLKDSM